jgi:hypothetical protein
MWRFVVRPLSLEATNSSLAIDSDVSHRRAGGEPQAELRMVADMFAHAQPGAALFVDSPARPAQRVFPAQKPEALPVPAPDPTAGAHRLAQRRKIRAGFDDRAGRPIASKSGLVHRPSVRCLAIPEKCINA